MPLHRIVSTATIDGDVVQLTTFDLI